MFTFELPATVGVEGLPEKLRPRRKRERNTDSSDQPPRHFIFHHLSSFLLPFHHTIPPCFICVKNHVSQLIHVKNTSTQVRIISGVLA